MSVTHCLVNGADRGDWFVASKDTSGGVVRAAWSWRVLWCARRSEANRGAIGRARGSNVSLSKIWLKTISTILLLLVVWSDETPHVITGTLVTPVDDLNSV